MEKEYSAKFFSAEEVLTNKNYKKLIELVQEKIVKSGKNFDVVVIKDSDNNIIETIGYKKDNNPPWFFEKKTNIQ